MTTTINPTQPEAIETEGKKTRKARNVEKLPLYPVAEGTKLDKTPADFNPATHSLVKKQFKDIPTYMEHQAYMCELRAADLRKKAEEYRINPPKREAGAKKAKLLDRLSKLEAKLAELGVNVADLLVD